MKSVPDGLGHFRELGLQWMCFLGFNGARIKSSERQAVSEPLWLAPRFVFTEMRLTYAWYFGLADR